MRLLFWRKPKKKPISPLWLLALIPAGVIGYAIRERPWSRTAKPVAKTHEWQNSGKETEKSGKESRGNKSGMEAVQSEARTRYQKGGKSPAEIEQHEDELEVIEGIGPKIAGILRKHGVTTFRDLANTSIDRLNEILHDSGIRINPPDSWPKQARLAANEDWEGLEDLKKRLHAGRE